MVETDLRYPLEYVTVVFNTLENVNLYLILKYLSFVRQTRMARFNDGIQQWKFILKIDKKNLNLKQPSLESVKLSYIMTFTHKFIKDLIYNYCSNNNSDSFF